MLRDSKQEIYLNVFISFYLASFPVSGSFAGCKRIETPPGGVEDGYGSKLESVEHKTFILKL